MTRGRNTWLWWTSKRNRVILYVQRKNMKEIYKKLEELGAKSEKEMLQFWQNNAETVDELADVLQTGKWIVSTLEEKKAGNWWWKDREEKK